MLLSELKPGQKAKITEIIETTEISGGDVQRLSDLGIISGTKIEALYKSPFGNPTAYLIRGTVFALRNETADKIKIAPL